MEDRMLVRCVRALFLAAGLAIVAAHTGALHAQPASKALKVEDFLNYETVADPQLSPDGTQVVYTRRWVNQMEDKIESALWVMGADGSKNRFLTKGSDAAWSPDGTRLAYIADGEPKGPQIFVRWISEAASSQITHVEHAPSNVTWSPDGKQLAFTMLEPKPSKWDIGMPKEPEGAKWTKAPAVIDK